MQHIAPKKSKAHLRLLFEVQENEIPFSTRKNTSSVTTKNKKSLFNKRKIKPSYILRKRKLTYTPVRRLLWLINAHDQLISFPLVCQNLKHILILLKKYQPNEIYKQDIENWIDISDWVIVKRTKLANKIKGKFDHVNNLQTKNPLVGHGAKRHPFYTALCSRPENPAYTEKFFLVMGHFLLTHISQFKKHISLQSYNSYDKEQEINSLLHSIYPASQGLRALSDPDAEIFFDYLTPKMSHKDFIKSALNNFPSVDQLRKNSTFKISNDRLKKIVQLRRKIYTLINFMAKNVRIKKWIIREKSKKKSNRFNKRARNWINEQIPDMDEAVPLDLSDSDDDYSNWGRQVVIEYPPSNVIDDIPQEELDGEEELILSDYSCETIKKGAASLAMAARGQVRHVEMENQLFPWRYRSLTINEIALLMSQWRIRFDKLNQQNNIKTNDDITELESIILIIIALWTGSTFARVHKLEILRSPHQKSNAELALIIDSSNKHIIEWRVLSHFPTYKTTISIEKHLLPLLRKNNKYVFLPDILGIERYIHYLRNRESNITNKFFKQDLSIYQQKIKSLLNEISPDQRITEHKITTLLFNQLQQESGDIANAVALTGQEHRLAQTRIFYSTPSLNKLRETYVKTVDGLASDVYTAINKTKPKHFASIPRLKNTYTGSRLCPTFNAVVKAVEEMKLKLKNLQSYHSRDGFRQYHNLYTLYTTQMFGYATGCRAIISPLIPLDTIDIFTGLTSLSDKDGKDGNKSRLVWIPNIVLEQLHQYEAHIDAVLRQHGDDLFKQQSPLNAKLFFIDEKKYQAIPVRPKTIEFLLNEFLPVKANSHRRFMRTEFSERGLNPEYYDAWMGHWSQGEEPWGRFSSFSFSDYLNELKIYLEPLLKELGWNSISSTLVNNND